MRATVPSSKTSKVPAAVAPACAARCLLLPVSLPLVAPPPVLAPPLVVAPLLPVAVPLVAPLLVPLLVLVSPQSG